MARKSKAATKKKVVAKKKVKAKAGRKVSADPKVKPGKGVPKIAHRRDVLGAVPKAGVKVSVLMEKTGATRSTINTMVEMGFLVAS